MSPIQTLSTPTGVPAFTGAVTARAQDQTLLNVSVAGDRNAAGKLLEGHDNVEKVEERDEMLIVTLKAGVMDYSDLPTMLIQAGHKLTLFREDELNLETAFMALTKGITA